MFENLSLYNFVLVALNLIVLYIILKKILFKPITEFMEKRTQSIKESIEEAEKQKAEANELNLLYKDKIKEAKKESEKIITDATTKANKIYDEIIAKAKADASFVMKDARKEIEHEREQMLKDIHNQIVDLTINAASKIIEADMDKAENIKIIEKFLGEEGAA